MERIEELVKAMNKIDMRFINADNEIGGVLHDISKFHYDLEGKYINKVYDTLNELRDSIKTARYLIKLADGCMVEK